MQWAERIGRRIKLRDLHVLHTVVQSGSMTKGARDLAISVPVVSKAIADLEHTVGVRLLDRSAQGVAPTAYGLALLHRSAAAFDELRQGIKDIEFLADPTAGEVRVGSTSPLAASFVSAVIERLSRRYPRIHFHLVVAETETLYRNLNERNVDCLIARNFGSIFDERLGFEALYDNPYVVAAGTKSPWARRRKVELADLVNENWALPPPDTLVGSVVVMAFRACGLEFPRANVVTFPHDVRYGLLATGRYLSVFPSSMLNFPTKHPGLKQLPVELKVPRMPIGVFSLKDRTLSPVAQLFVDYARDIARPLAKKKF